MHEASLAFVNTIADTIADLSTDFVEYLYISVDDYWLRTATSVAVQAKL